MTKTSRRGDFKTVEIIKALHEADGVISTAAKELGVPRKTLAYWIEREDDIGSVLLQIKTTKQLQKVKDESRIKNANFRTVARAENAISSLLEDLVAVVQSYPMHLDGIAPSIKSDNQKNVGVIQFSDLHFNEEINLPHNQFNFNVASKRVQKHIHESLKYFKNYDIDKVVVAFTGDLLNSDRRLDELLVNSMNRAQAVFVAADILQQAIQDVLSSYPVVVASVTGNESRIPKDIGWVDSIATDNYDYIIHRLLELMYSKNKNIIFLEGDPLELVINIAGQNLLLVHGHGNTGGKDLSTRALKTVGRYAAEGIILDYIISGHTHESYIGDYFARSSSLAGANDYSEKALNLPSRAAQNCYVFQSDGAVHGFKVDLQNVDNYSGYPYHRTLEAYNTKSESKINELKRVLIL